MTQIRYEIRFSRRIKLKKVKVLYFARLREAFKLDREEIELTERIFDVETLKKCLAERGESWSYEFASGRAVKVAINQTVVGNQARLNDGDEVAFFPPVTGG